MILTRLISLILLILIISILSVDKHKFKTCSQSSFCNRNRQVSGSTILSDYYIDTSSVSLINKSTFTVSLVNKKFKKLKPLVLNLDILINGIVRLQINEKDPIHPRFHVPDVIQSESLINLSDKEIKDVKKSDKELKVNFNIDSNSYTIVLNMDPFSLELDVNGLRAITANSRGLLNFEEYRNEKHPKPIDVTTTEQDYPYDTDGMFEESFGSHTDSKPRGPSAISLDFTFENSQHIYGLPEHASSLALKNTQGEADIVNNDGSTTNNGIYSEPYRLYNLDVFEYELDSSMALYGAIPFVMSHSADKSVGLLWLNAAETFIDVSSGKDKNGNPFKSTHFISESGIIDVFFFLGPTPNDVFHSYSALTGFAAMPQLFAIAYHQCRWNYKDEKDVASVDSGFDENDIPYDVLWLDIEHTDSKKYFTWDQSLFPNPQIMQQNLAAKGRKMVTIVDPHTKRDSNYRLHNDANSQSLYIKTKSNSDYDGWCWPGSVSYLDFLEPKVREFWVTQFKYENYIGSTPTLYTWNDMNEPSVFNGPEVTMPKDNLHLNNFEHRDVHNMYGFYQHMATHFALESRNTQLDRPFVLTRSFFAGSQRFGPVWTGDNKAEWSHLAATVPMLLSLNIAGISFSGADVGGFFGNPDTELFIRWFQAGAFQPFFRGHAHIDTKRREPWSFGHEVAEHVKNAIRIRYAILPYFYTIFFLNSHTGIPIMRPLWAQYSDDMHTFGMDNQYLLGNDLLVHPVVAPGQSYAHVYLPGNSVWFDLENGAMYVSKQTVSIPTPLNKIPVMLRGGGILFRKERVRRSSKLMEKDPYTLVVALDNGAAKGVLYVDDGHSYDYKTGKFMIREFTFNNNEFITTTPTCVSGSIVKSSKCVKIASGSLQLTNVIERIVILGFKVLPKSIVMTVDGVKSNLEFSVDSNSRLIIRKPDVPISSLFSIKFE